MEILRTEVTDVIGTSASNVAGIRLQSSEGVVIHHSVVHDILAEGTGGNIWSHGVILFGGGNHRLHYNEFFATPPRMSPMRRSCVLYKHSATIEGSTFEVDHNVFRGCEGRAWGPVGLTTFSDNIVVDSATYDAEHGVVTIGTYLSDSLFGQTVTAGNLSFTGNCYFNAGDELQFNLFNAGGGSYGDLGDVYDFAGWQALGYGTDSVVADPMLDDDYAPARTECANAGWRAL